MQKKTTTLCTPADVFANIPGMLGFFPQDSFVIGFFMPKGTRGYELGPLARVSIADAKCYRAVFEGLCYRPEGMIVFVYVIFGERGYTSTIMHVRRLVAEAAEQGIRIEAAWGAKEIQAGEPYELLFGPHAYELGNGTTGLECWDSGEIAPPIASISLRELAAKGELPEPDREAVFAYFNASAQHKATAEQRTRWEERGVRQGLHLVDGIRQGTPEARRMFTQAIEDCFGILNRITTEQLSVDTLAVDGEFMEFAAAYWSQILLRDAIFVALGHGAGLAEAMSKLALASARTFQGEIRANSLCAYAAAMLAQKLWVRVLPAVRVALEEVPQHRLAALFENALIQGLTSMTLESCVQAAEYLTYRYGEQLPEAA